MKDKWILPSIKEYEESESMYQDHNRAIQAESDLTDALDMLESLIDDTFSNRTHIARKDKIEQFINRFKPTNP